MSIPAVKLSNGLSIPASGLGTYKEEKSEVLVNAIKAAVKAGVRHFDCAYCYYNEKHIGQALRDSIAESNGALKREDFFITSKLWNTFRSRDRVQLAVKECLERFGFDYLDLYLIHWPMDFAEDKGDYPMNEDGTVISGNIPFTETYKYMEELVDQGKVKSIGISNFNIAQTKEILGMCRIKPVCNQIEVHPLLQNNALVDFCQSENIAIVAYAPLGAPDRPWQKEGEPAPLQHPLILDIAKKYNKTPAQVILRWLVQRNIIPIAKSVTPSRIEQNTQIFDFSLTNEDMDVFKTSFKDEFRFYKFEPCKKMATYPF